MKVGVVNKPLVSGPRSQACREKERSTSELTDMDRVNQDPGHSHVYVNM